MKSLFIILGLSIFQPPANIFEITVQISNVEKQAASARVLLYQHNNELLKDIRTNGAFSTMLHQGTYRLKIIRCDTTIINFNADRKKMVWVVINTDCAQ